MSKVTAGLGALLLLGGAAVSGQGPVAPQAVADELIAADRAYSASGSTVGLVDSLGAMMDDQAVMPTPSTMFATGKAEVVAALRANPANAQGKAEWSPVRAGVSGDGRRGFTYGFMTIREAGKPDRRAKYLAYWVKQADEWKVALYKRSGSAPGNVQSVMRPPALPRAIIAPASVVADKAGLVAVEKAFSDRAQVVGLRQAFAEFGSADAMNMGRGSDFTYGNEAIAADLPTDVPSPVHWAADAGALVASSGDLGVTWGRIRLHSPSAGQPPAIPFFTVWRKAAPGEPWKYVAE